MLGTRNLLLAAALTTTTAMLGCGSTLSQQISRDMSDQSGAYQAWWNQQIVYHRDDNVYFSPQDEEYYFFEDGQWQQASTLPARITLSHDDVSFVKRSKLLTITANSTDVMALNPHYEPAAEPPAMPDDDAMPMLTEADTDADATPTTSDEEAMQTTLVEENE